VNDSRENIDEDRHLVDKVLAGNSQAFGVIIKKTEGLVAQIIFKMISNSEERKDIAQDTYLKGFKNLSGFKFQSKLSTWIAKIAYNTCLNYLEKKKLILHDSNSYDDVTDEEEFPGYNARSANEKASEPEILLFQKQQSEILKAEIEKLAPLFKTLITLYHSEGLSYQEIVEITGLPDGTVKSYLFRARKTLKNNLLLKYKREEL
jgi:RNA polymerase sigma factor (sigma-70 family)